MPVESNRKDFLLEQPFWLAGGASSASCWDLALREQEPEIAGLKSAIDPGPEPEAESREGKRASWTRIGRDDLVTLAHSHDANNRRIGVVSGAGLGKSTNLRWLAAAINASKSGIQFAYLCELRDLPEHREELLESMTVKLHDKIQVWPRAKIRLGLERFVATGRITFLLDSLDQADPDPTGRDVCALRMLDDNFRPCRIWLSGRPYAFRTARTGLESLPSKATWRFLRIGQLDEPETRQLLETTRRPEAR